MKVNAKQLIPMLVIVLAVPGSIYLFNRNASKESSSMVQRIDPTITLAELTSLFFKSYSFDNQKLLAKDETVFRQYCAQIASDFLAQHNEEVVAAILGPLQVSSQRMAQAQAEISKSYAPLLAKRFEAAFAKTRQNHAGSLV